MEINFDVDDLKKAISERGWETQLEIVEYIITFLLPTYQEVLAVGKYVVNELADSPYELQELRDYINTILE